MKSARIKRRNRQGFSGEGSYKGLSANHQYGDYKDFREESDIRMVNLINRAKNCGSRHPGSKRPAQLRLYNS